MIRAFNYNTMEKVHMLEAHTDYIRSIAVHPTQPFVLSSSDDMTIKLWDWEKKWECTQTFEAHTHYVMCVVFNPKDTNTFASASLDRTIKVWQIGASAPNFTLEGHEKGVNVVEYFLGGEKPYLISGADDRLVKIWDYQNKTCVQTLEGHQANVCAVCFHPELPIILTGSEDGTVRVWHSNTYRPENTLNYGLERVWSMSFRKGSNNIAIGYDEGTIMIKLGREEPAVSMDSSGKILWSKHNEVQQANLAKITEDLKDGEPIALSTKELGSTEIYPQSLTHNPNGRFVVVCGDGEYVIHTALNLRNKSFGSALDFVWAPTSEYAIRETSSKVKIFKNFKERAQVKIDFSAEAIYGGACLGIKGGGGLTFFAWDTAEPIRRIEIEALDVYWSPAGDRIAIATEESFYILKYDADAVTAALASGEEIDEEGIEDAFDLESEVEEIVQTGVWVGDCFLYTNNANRLNYHVGGEIVTVSHLDRPMYILGYLTSTGRVYLCDKDVTVVSFALNQAVLEYQTAVMREDLEAADSLLEQVPTDQRTRVAHFLEKQGFKEQALMVSVDEEHRFELAVGLGRLDVAKEMAGSIESEQKWKQLGEVAMRQSMFDLAEECMDNAKDYSGQLLLYTAAGKAEKLSQLAEKTSEEEKTNIAFMSLLLQGKLDECIALLVKTERHAEAALFARSYAPSKISEVVSVWQEDLAKTNPKAASALADPKDYPNLFPELEQSLGFETYVRENLASSNPAASYKDVCAQRETPLEDRAAGSVPAAAAAAAEPEQAGGEEAEAEEAKPEEAKPEEEEAAPEEEVEPEEAAAEENVDDLDLDGSGDGDGDGGDDDADLDDEDLLGSDGDSN